MFGMDLMDKVALWGRRYEPRLNPRTGDYKFALKDLLEEFQVKTILELVPFINNSAGQTYRANPERRLKLSLLDEGGSLLAVENISWFEILRTAPSGDYARYRIVAKSSSGANLGELRMLVAERLPAMYFADDPFLMSPDITSWTRRR